MGNVGRISPIKGQHLFLEAFAQAFQDGSQRAAIIGAPLFGEFDYLDRLRRAVPELGLEGRVDFRGFRQDVQQELQTLDILVVSSTVPEGLAQTVAEGMAAGLPVVAPAQGGPRELIDDGGTGLLFRPGDASALAVALTRLAGDQALRRRIGQNARSALTGMEPEDVERSLIGFYDVLLGSTRSEARS